MRLSQVLQRAVGYFNPTARFILNTRLHPLMSRRLMLISFNGRVTGRPYTTPVSYVEEEGSLLVPGGGKWWKNIETTPQTRVRLRGAWAVVTPEVVRESQALSELMRRMLAANPAIAQFTGVKPGPDGGRTQTHSNASAGVDLSSSGSVSTRLTWHQAHRGIPAPHLSRRARARRTKWVLGISADQIPFVEMWA